jgi:DNA-binding CsgD family transcriptional regulator
MFETLFTKLVSGSAVEARRDEGAAFLKAAKDLYRVDCVGYLCLNLPVGARSPQFGACAYSDASVRHCVGEHTIDVSQIEDHGLKPLRTQSNIWMLRTGGSRDEVLGLAISLLPRAGEIAFFGIGASGRPDELKSKARLLLREVRILADYFHSHLLRISGHNSEERILISARELDCLKWTAAGKTAWEASVILGISERTVRFHLNAAREKLRCATTTQAVAKAVGSGLIAV